MQQQRGEQGARLGAADRDRDTAVDVTSSGPRIRNSTAVPTPDEPRPAATGLQTRRSESNAMDLRRADDIRLTGSHAR